MSLDETLEYGNQKSLQQEILSINMDLAEIQRKAQLNKMLFLRSQIIERPQINLEVGRYDHRQPQIKNMGNDEPISDIDSEDDDLEKSDA